MRVARLLVAVILVLSVLSGAALAKKTEFYGVVEQMPPYGPYGIWIISGQNVLVTGETKMKVTKAPIGLGTAVKVRGVYYGNQFTATEIKTK